MIKTAAPSVRRPERRPNETASTPTLRIDVDDQARAWLINFHSREICGGTKFQWSKPVAMIRLTLPADDYVVRLNTGGIRGCTSRLAVDLFWNDQRIPDEAIAAVDGRITFHVPRARCNDDLQQHLLLMTEPLLVAAPETRQLGLPFVDLEVWQSEALPFEKVRSATAFRPHQRIRDLWRRPKARFPGWALDGIRDLTFPAPIAPRLPPAAPVPTHSAAEVEEAPTAEAREKPVICDAAIVCPNEINSRHGTGVLLQYMFPQLDRMAVLESQRCYNRERVRTGVTCELPEGLPRSEVYRYVLDWFRHAPPRRAFVVPYFASDVLMALALKDLYGTSLVLHVMDDNTLIEHGIPIDLMEELIAEADLRFAISPEMRVAYEHRFGHKFYLLPPVVQEDLISIPYEPLQPKHERGAIIGNLWSPAWIDRLADTVCGTEIHLDWFCNNPGLPCVGKAKERLKEAGVYIRDPLWGEDLVKELRRRPFLVLPTGDTTDRNGQAIAQLSLPSRAVFHAAAIRTPMLVLGSSTTAVAQFVNHFNLGTVAPYDSNAFKSAAESLLDQDATSRVFAVGEQLAGSFSSTGIESWIWSSLKQGSPADDRFECLFPPKPNLAGYVTPPSPGTLHWGQHEIWQVLHRYRSRGIHPKTIVDVGASTGCWSSMAKLLFPEAHFVLCEPLFRRYPKSARDWHVGQLSSYEVIESVVSNHCGVTSLTISESLYGSSLFAVDDVHGPTCQVEAVCTTLDALARQRRWKGPVLLKADVQFAEHLVIEGATQMLAEKIDAVLLELSLKRGHESAKTYAEMVAMMADLGFDIFDESGGWRHPRTGQLEQKDVLFVKTCTNDRGHDHA